MFRTSGLPRRRVEVPDLRRFGRIRDVVQTQPRLELTTGQHAGIVEPVDVAVMGVVAEGARIRGVVVDVALCRAVNLEPELGDDEGIARIVDVDNSSKAERR